MDLKHRIPFHRRLFIYMMLLFSLFLVCFLSFQYQREKNYKIEQLNNKLQLLNLRFAEIFTTNSSNMERYINECSVGEFENLRVTIIDTAGVVLFDSQGGKRPLGYANHANRPEVKAAIKNGAGYTIRRLSQSMHQEYFYSATKIDNRIIRSALQYSLPLREILRADRKFLWFMLIVALIISGAAYLVTRRLGHNIDKLKHFAMKADKGENLDDIGDFPKDELGEISNHIVRLYTQLRRTKEALENEHNVVIKQGEDQIRLKKQLTQNINHELKTPVSSIQGYLDILINNPSISPEKKEDFINKSYIQVNRLANLLSDISTITRIDEASNMIEKENTDLICIIDNVFTESEDELKMRGIKTKIEMPRTLSIFGNSSLLHSIFRNLLDNALAYSGCNLIELKVEFDSENTIAVTFSDNGVGVNEEHLSRIFERFYRVDKGRSRKIGGTGLGLSIVKNAVLLHGGKIVARSRAEGGLEFVFTLELVSLE